MDSVSVIMPVLNEAATIEHYLRPLQALRARHCELIVVDGGSTDASRELARPLADRIVRSAKGRAVQMNAGAAAARGDILWFLHGDTLVPDRADALIRRALTGSARVWGRFDVRLSGNHPLLWLVGAMMNIRSCVSGIATGDQGIFVRRDVFERIGGFPAIGLMEDIEISKRLKQIGHPVCLRQPLITSSRRWQQNGIVRTIILMWTLRLLYFCGVGPERLRQIYYKK